MKSLEEILRERDLERQQRTDALLASQARNATTPQQKIGYALGTVLGTYLGEKFNPVEATDQELERERARQGLFQGAQQNEMTPDGGMRSVPREMSIAEDLNYKADQFLDFYAKYGDTEARDTGMKFKQLALDEAQSQRKAVGQLTPRQKWISNYVNSSQLPVTLEEANKEYDKLLLIGAPGQAPQLPEDTQSAAPTAPTAPAAQAVAPSGRPKVPQGAKLNKATSTPLAVASIPIGTDIVDQATVNQRVDEQLAKAGLSRDTAPPALIKTFEELEKLYRPYGN